ncbi:MAG: hypothetical protein PHC51_11875 [bacterium]|nr:hypothetical protein [bacterium]
MTTSTPSSLKHKCTISERSFEISPAEVHFYQTLGLPLPTLCPAERHKRRISFRNFTSLYKRKCDATGQNIISMYHQDQKFPVYQKDFWWTDQWSAEDYGLDYNCEESFLKQYARLASQVPRSSLMAIQCEDCDYVNMANSSARCHLVFGCVGNEDCIGGHIVWNSKDCFENLYLYRCELCSNSIDLYCCYDLHWCQDCINCQCSMFLFNCQNCSDCFGCSGLQNAHYCFFNEQLTKEAYSARLAEYYPSDTVRLAQLLRAQSMQIDNTSRDEIITGTRNESVSGRHIFDSGYVNNSSDIKRSRDMVHCQTVQDGQDCIDLSFSGGPIKFCNECLTVSNCERVHYSHLLSNCSDSFYSEFCHSSSFLFGCNGLKNKSYCILNRQYSADEYEAVKKKIVESMIRNGEWGEFFPAEMSPFTYQESIASEYYPLKNKSSGEDKVSFEVRQALPFDETAGIYTCQLSGERYRVTKQEKIFYERKQFPIPAIAPLLRHKDRMAKRRNLQL